MPFSRPFVLGEELSARRAGLPGEHDDGGRAPCRVHAAHQGPDRHLLRRQYSDGADCNSGARRVARSPGHGEALGGGGEPPWRERHRRAPARACICGNTHFPLLDLNNLEIAELLSAFLKKKGLD
jgi:hypothetical protein